ncbi:TPA: bifunctional N-acetylglucosamine-1-phosphate uridyltransferase/glucosamine-1-phosphate acetyltransferase [Candidatus Bipolaricaulota bacterium]|nr:bifunctional N-acetylglucosamine-1-phosphate uridyltransferase/glucosamine-1-phosphate acetyltransferase [Candidatus Bipolaricaulota bacterium]
MSLLILAAGKGKRMRSAKVKVLHELCGRPLLEYLLEAVAPLEAVRTVVVIGHQGERVRERFEGRGLTFVEQREQLGTGHAALQAYPILADRGGEILILPGDLPLLRGDLLQEFLLFHRGHRGRLSLLTMELEDPQGYGRIVRDPQGDILRIVEEKDATEEERSIREVNSGIYLVRNDELLWEALRGLEAANLQGEYYLPDIISSYRARGERVRALMAADGEELLGINSRADLLRAEAILQRRKLEEVLASGVTVSSPETVLIDWEVRLARDVHLGPGSILRGRSRIGEGAQVEGSRVEGFELGRGCKAIMSLFRFKEEKGSEE